MLSPLNSCWLLPVDHLVTPSSYIRFNYIGRDTLVESSNDGVDWMRSEEQEENQQIQIYRTFDPNIVISGSELEKKGSNQIIWFFSPIINRHFVVMVIVWWCYCCRSCSICQRVNVSGIDLFERLCILSKDVTGLHTNNTLYERIFLGNNILFLLWIHS